MTTKLQEMIGETICQEPSSSYVAEVIETMAEWFDLVLEDMGIQPSSIPALLRWQYHVPMTQQFHLPITPPPQAAELEGAGASKT
jgi:predicted TPR repeat methyltransferase